MTILYSLNKPMLSTIIITAVLCVFFILFYFLALRKIDPLKKTPKWLIPFLFIVDLINVFVKDNIGVRWKTFAPWFLSLTIFIFFANISAVYLLENPTSYIMVTFTLAMCSFFVIQGAGILSNGGLGYLKSFLDPNPIMLPMNIISDISLPISLCLRLLVMLLVVLR